MKRSEAEAEVRDFHCSAFDPLVGQVRQYALEEFGLQFLAQERITVIPYETAKQWQARRPTFGGGYNAATHEALVLERRLAGKPLTTNLITGSFLMHEGMHSASYHPDKHYFFNEAVAGLGEHAYLTSLRKREATRAAGSFTLQKAGAEIVIPGDFRYAQAPEFDNEPVRGSGGAHTSQALIAAAGVSIALPLVGLTAADVLKRSTLHGTAHFEAMEEALRTLRPGLVEDIQALPGNLDGAVQATALIQSVRLDTR